MKLTEIAIKRPAFMTMIFTALAVVGLFSYSIMGVDFLPKMEWPMVLVSVVYPGAGPKEVETQISKPVEEALSSLNNLKSIRTYSNENVSVGLVEFNMSADVNVALSDVDRKINEIKINLPKDILQPQIVKININSLPILRIAATSTLEGQKFYQLMKDKIKPRLEQADGVSSVVLVGGKEREIRVEIDNDKLKAFNLSLPQVTQVIGAENLDFPTGNIEQPEKKYTVRVAGKFNSVESIRNVIIASTSSGTIKLSDVAEVKDTYKEEYTYSRLDGTNGMGLIISKASDANSIKTSERVQKVIKELEKEFAADNLKFTVSQDITEFTKASVNEVYRDLGLAILMVALILFVFLHDLKNALIVLLSIPTSLISTFIMMNVFGFTINLITLMSLTLVIGILVDDSIVVLENIHRHLEMGEKPVDAAIKGRSEIGMAAIAITLVDVVVFLPISMVGGIVGKIFREFGLTIVVSTLLSLFVSFTLTPMLAARWSRVVQITKENLLGRFVLKFNSLETRLAARYKQLLGWALDHRKAVIGLCFFLLIAGLAMLPAGMIGTEFMPSVDRGEFAIEVEMPLGTNIERTNEAMMKIEKMISQSPDVERFYSVTGRTEQSWGEMNKPHLAQIQVKLKDGTKRKTQDVIEEFLAKANGVPGVKATASLIGIMGSADEAPIYLEIKGTDLDELVKASDKVFDIVKKAKGTRDVKNSWQEGQPELRVVIDRAKCADAGMTLGEVGQNLRNALEGDISTKFNENDTEYDMRILLSKKNRQNPDDISNLTMLNRFGKQIRLGDVARVFHGKGPSTIQRKDKIRVITITANLDDSRPLSEVTNEIKAQLETANLPQGINVGFAGASEDMQTMFSDMLLAIFFAIIFVYMIMVSLYESYMNPFIIMFSLPVALFGAFMALFLTGLNLNMFSMIGILMSMGLVTKNAILIVDYTNTIRRTKGVSLREALLEAGPIRLRPIIMTTSTMIIGLLPMAASAGGAGDMRTGLAVVVIGALVSSTLLTLVLVPVMYMVMDGLRSRFGRKKVPEAGYVPEATE